MGILVCSLLRNTKSIIDCISCFNLSFSYCCAACWLMIQIYRTHRTHITICRCKMLKRTGNLEVANASVTQRVHSFHCTCMYERWCVSTNTDSIWSRDLFRLPVTQFTTRNSWQCLLLSYILMQMTCLFAIRVDCLVSILKCYVYLFILKYMYMNVNASIGMSVLLRCLPFCWESGSLSETVWDSMG